MRSDYWGQGANNALLLVGDFFQHSLNAQFIAGADRFPYERPAESIWDPVLEAARDWFGGIFKDLGLGEKSPSAPPPPRRERDLEYGRD